MSPLIKKNTNSNPPNFKNLGYMNKFKLEKKKPKSQSKSFENLKKRKGTHTVKFLQNRNTTNIKLEKFNDENCGSFNDNLINTKKLKLEKPESSSSKQFPNCTSTPIKFEFKYTFDSTINDLSNNLSEYKCTPEEKPIGNTFINSEHTPCPINTALIFFKKKIGDYNSKTNDNEIESPYFLASPINKQFNNNNKVSSGSNKEKMPLQFITNTTNTTQSPSTYINHYQYPDTTNEYYSSGGNATYDQSF